MAILVSVRRSSLSLERYGHNVTVLLHAGENHRMEAIVQTSQDYLIIYIITMSSQHLDSRYKLDTSRTGSSHRRRSFAGTGEPELIIPYSIKYKKTIKVDSGLSWYIWLCRR
jgi:hypothetical protein